MLDNEDQNQGKTSGINGALVFRVKDIQGNLLEIKGNLNDSISTLGSKYKKEQDIKGNCNIIISLNGKLLPADKTIKEALLAVLKRDPDPEEIESLTFNVIVRLTGGK